MYDVAVIELTDSNVRGVEICNNSFSLLHQFQITLLPQHAKQPLTNVGLGYINPT